MKNNFDSFLFLYANLFHANLEIVIEMILFMHVCIVKRKYALPPAVRPERLNTKIMKHSFAKGNDLCNFFVLLTVEMMYA